MKSSVFMNKAQSALRAARLLLDNGYADDACNRAYYAMFDGARAALLVVGAPVQAEEARTHRGLISAFGQYVVKPGRLPAGFGNRAGGRAGPWRHRVHYRRSGIARRIAIDAMRNLPRASVAMSVSGIRRLRPRRRSIWARLRRSRARLEDQVAISLRTFRR